MIDVSGWTDILNKYVARKIPTGIKIKKSFFKALVNSKTINIPNTKRNINEYGILAQLYGIPVYIYEDNELDKNYEIIYKDKEVI